MPEQPAKRQVFRVMAMDPVRRVWTARGDYEKMSSATIQATACRQAGLRVRIVPATKAVVQIKPPHNSEARRAREEHEQQMSDRADAKKYYKSPG